MRSTGSWCEVTEDMAGQLVLCAWAIALAPVMVPNACAADAVSSTLRPGAQMNDCRSALRPGPTNCGELPANPAGSSTAKDPGSALLAAPPGTVPEIEAQIDAALAGYGKPPREAIRALLDPSESNIRALLRKQEETLAVAAFVAARMTQMQTEVAGPRAPKAALPPPDLPSLMQMSVTLLQAADDPEALAAYDALLALAREVPSLRAQVALVGTLAPQELRARIARIPAPLGALALRPDQCAAEALPYLAEQFSIGKNDA